jgi:3-oxoacyl-[acyl-carrier protein] reductase
MLNNKVALVCASSAGIGRGIATRLAEAGCHVALLGRRAVKLEEAATEISKRSNHRVMPVVCDLSNIDEVEKAYQKVRESLGPVDILINNQGGPPPGEILDISLEQLHLATKTNVVSVFRLCQLCIPEMKERKWGRVINVLSISGKQPLPNMLLSNMLRPTILGLAKSLSNQYAKDGITVNSLLPANVLTDRTTSLLTNKAQSEGRSFEDVVEECAQGVPLKRMTTPEEFGQSAAFLASEEASFLTGLALPVDGGLSQSLL